MRLVQAVLSPRKNGASKSSKHQGGGEGAKHTEEKEEGIHNPTNDEDDAFVHDDEDLTWTLVSEAAGAEEPSYGTRGAKTPHSAKNNKGKGIATSSTQSKRYGTSAPHLELVDEDDDAEEELGKEDGSFWKDLELEYEESGSESE
ncbi:hypothetical protein F2Q69_00029305 [Brassica cretica]|uniref:Uncharacterized protein n=1 Tax=Brassica cretica TaxID=69181 RepID=A0A8S9RZJ0_BRACR|nr:hypothetical protein F2Q69_00029305 [Brassica cretica]